MACACRRSKAVCAMPSLSSAAALKQYDSLASSQCGHIVSRLKSSLQIVDMPLVAQELNANRILTPHEFARLQDRSCSDHPQRLLDALRRTGVHGLKSFHRALERTSGQAPGHKDVLLVLVAKGVCLCVHGFMHDIGCVCVCMCVCLYCIIMHLVIST